MVGFKEHHKEFTKNNTLILKSSQKFKRERHAFTEKVHRIILSSIDGKRIKSIDSVETFAWAMISYEEKK